MKLIHRLGYYLGGLSIGLIFLAFFLTGKRTSCDYGPTARVLKNIRTKTITYDERIKAQLFNYGIDSTDVMNILTYGDVNFRQSNTKLDSCKTYVIEGYHDEQAVLLTFANCETEAKLIELKTE